MRKRILLISIMVCMLVCLFALSVSADTYNDTENGVVYTLNDDNTALVNNLISGAKVVTIPSTVSANGQEYKVVGFEEVSGSVPNVGGTFLITTISEKNSVEELYITSEYITVIPRIMMRSSTSLKKLYITSPIEHFMHECFFGCTKMADVYIKFDNTNAIDQSAFLFSGDPGKTSNAVWNYNEEPINLYNVKNISPQAFASTRIGGKNVPGGQENTIIWPKKLETFGVFAFTNGCVGGTVYFNAEKLVGLKNGEGNKQFSLANYFETLIIGPDTKELRNLNNAKDNNKDNAIKGNLKTVIILSKDMINGNSRTNLFDNWGAFDLYYYADTTTATTISKQTTIGDATKHIITDHTFDYTNCQLSLMVSSDGTVKIENSYHYTGNDAGVIDEAKCPLGSVKNYICVYCKGTVAKYSDGYNASNVSDHNISNLSYTSAISRFAVGNFCTKCTYEYGEKTEYEPIVELLGYSAKENGNEICVGFGINKESYNKYIELGNTFNFGVVFAMPIIETFNGTILNADGTAAIQRAVSAPVNLEFDTCDFIITDFDYTEKHCDMDIFLGAYVSNITSVEYIGLDSSFKLVQSSVANTFTMNELAAEIAKNEQN